MKKYLLSLFAFISILQSSRAEFGVWASAVYLNVGGTSQFYSTYLLNDPNSIGTVNFTGILGSFAQNSNALTLRGAEIKTFKDNGGNVCGGILYYTVYPVGARPASPVFTGVGLDFYCDCASDGTFNACGGGTCTNGRDQKWQKIDQTNDLTQLASGDYTLELYYQISGAATTNTCGETRYDSNSGNNYTANFTITPPLALNFSGLSGIVQNNTVKLKWSIENDIDISKYEVERSANGINFNTVGTVASQRSVASFSYSLTDNTPAEGTNYYRVKLYGLDNSVTYSRLIKITYNNGVSHVQVLYMKSDELLVKFNIAPEGEYNLVVINNSGQQLVKKTFICNGSGNTISIKTPKPAKGIYRYKLVNREKNYSGSFWVE